MIRDIEQGVDVLERSIIIGKQTLYHGIDMSDRNVHIILDSNATLRIYNMANGNCDMAAQIMTESNHILL